MHQPGRDEHIVEAVHDRLDGVSDGCAWFGIDMNAVDVVELVNSTKQSLELLDIVVHEDWVSQRHVRGIIDVQIVVAEFLIQVAFFLWEYEVLVP